MATKVTFFGAGSGVGTTMIAQSVAEALAFNGVRVMFILASSSPFWDYCKQNGRNDNTIDSLRAKLHSDDVDKSDIMDICYKKDGFCILPPISNLTMIKYYKEDDIDRICELINEDFDYIIIDGGSNIQYPLGISALNSGEKVYIVVKQTEKSLNRFKLLAESVLNSMAKNYSIIVNDFIPESPYYSLRILEGLFKRKVHSIPYMKNGSDAELRRETLMILPRYRNGIIEFLKEEDFLDEYKEALEYDDIYTMNLFGSRNYN